MNLKIIWTNTAKSSLKDIYEFYKPKSERAAKNVIDNIINTTKKIQFPEQYQVDEIDERYRRMVVGNFKILYSHKDEIIRIHRIFDARQNPKKLKDNDN